MNLPPPIGGDTSLLVSSFDLKLDSIAGAMD